MAYTPPISNYQMEENYRSQLLKQQEIVIHYKDKERLRFEKENEMFEKKKQEFQLECALEMLSIEKTLANQQSYSYSAMYFIHPTRYRNQYSSASTDKADNQKFKMDNTKRINRFPFHFNGIFCFLFLLEN